MQRGSEHRFDAVIVADITPRNGVFKEIIGQKVGHNYPYLPQMKLRHFFFFNVWYANFPIGWVKDH